MAEAGAIGGEEEAEEGHERDSVVIDLNVVMVEMMVEEVGADGVTAMEDLGAIGGHRVTDHVAKAVDGVIVERLEAGGEEVQGEVAIMTLLSHPPAGADLGVVVVERTVVGVAHGQAEGGKKMRVMAGKIRVNKNEAGVLLALVVLVGGVDHLSAILEVVEVGEELS